MVIYEGGGSIQPILLIHFTYRVPHSIQTMDGSWDHQLLAEERVSAARDRVKAHKDDEQSYTLDAMAAMAEKCEIKEVFRVEPIKVDSVVGNKSQQFYCLVCLYKSIIK